MVPVDALIIGAGGQDGFYLLVELLKEGKKIVAVHRTHASCLATQEALLGVFGKPLTNLVNISANIQSKSICAEVLAKHTATTIYHLGGINLPSNSVEFSDPGVKKQMLDTHFSISENLLEGSYGLENCRIVIALSSKMFAKPTSRDIMISSSSLPAPSDYYGFTKSLAWDSIKYHRRIGGVDAIGVILFNHDSPRRKSGFLLPHLVSEFKRVLKKEKFDFKIDEWPSRQDWSDSRDIVLALAQLMNYSPKGDIAIGSGKGISVNQIVLETAELLNLDRASFCLDYNVPEFVPFRPTLIADVSEMNQLFPWEPKRSIASLILEQIK